MILKTVWLDDQIPGCVCCANEEVLPAILFDSQMIANLIYRYFYMKTNANCK